MCMTTDNIVAMIKQTTITNNKKKEKKRNREEEQVLGKSIGMEPFH